MITPEQLAQFRKVQPFDRPYKTKPCRHGEMIVPHFDMFVGSSLDVYGEWAELEVDYLCRLINKGDVVVDAGAFIGTHTIPFSRAVGPTGGVIAFEPTPYSFNCLAGNVVLNNLRNVVVKNQGLSDAVRMLSAPSLPPVGVLHNNGGNELRPDQQNSSAVYVLPLDSLNLNRCRLIKIDVEGHEEQVLKGAVETIKRTHPILSIEADRTDKVPGVLKVLRELDYLVCTHLTPIFNPDNFNGIPIDIFGGIWTIGLLAFPSQIESVIYSAFDRGVVPVLVKEDGSSDFERVCENLFSNEAKQSGK